MKPYNEMTDQELLMHYDGYVVEREYNRDMQTPTNYRERYVVGFKDACKKLELIRAELLKRMLDKSDCT